MDSPLIEYEPEYILSSTEQSAENNDNGGGHTVWSLEQYYIHKNKELVWFLGVEYINTMDERIDYGPSDRVIYRFFDEHCSARESAPFEVDHFGAEYPNGWFTSYSWRGSYARLVLSCLRYGCKLPEHPLVILQEAAAKVEQPYTLYNGVLDKTSEYQADILQGKESNSGCIVFDIEYFRRYYRMIDLLVDQDNEFTDDKLFLGDFYKWVNKGKIQKKIKEDQEITVFLRSKPLLLAYVNKELERLGIKQSIKPID